MEKERDNNPEPEQKEISWEAPEFEYYSKSPSWYWISILISIVLLAVALWQKNFLFAAFIIIAELSVFHWASALPRDINFKIDGNGVAIGQKRAYAFAELEHFSLNQSGGEIKELIFKHRTKFRPYIKLAVTPSLVPEIRSHLADFLPEEEYNEPMADVLAKFLRF
ncbi:MAG: hypothetical protein AAB560_01025 [Patescibacteria group bacterium]